MLGFILWYLVPLMQFVRKSARPSNSKSWASLPLLFRKLTLLYFPLWDLICGRNWLLGIWVEVNFVCSPVGVMCYWTPSLLLRSWGPLAGLGYLWAYTTSLAAIAPGYLLGWSELRFAPLLAECYYDCWDECGPNRLLLRRFCSSYGGQTWELCPSLSWTLSIQLGWDFSELYSFSLLVVQFDDVIDWKSQLWVFRLGWGYPLSHDIFWAQLNFISFLIWKIAASSPNDFKDFCFKCSGLNSIDFLKMVWCSEICLLAQRNGLRVSSSCFDLPQILILSQSLLHWSFFWISVATILLLFS